MLIGCSAGVGASVLMLVPGTLLEGLGWTYIGPIDGHDLPTLIATLRNMRDLDGPQFLHVVTKKGKGFAPAEADPITWHAISKLEPVGAPVKPKKPRSEEHTSELQSLMRISYAVFCLNKNKKQTKNTP